MPDQPADTPTRASLLDEIQRSRAAFLDRLAAFDEAELAAPRHDGWSVKDHLAHIASWEESLLAMLAGTDPYAPLGLHGDDTDALNEAIRARFADRSLAEVRGIFDGTHARVLARLQSLTDEDVSRPYSSYQPTATRRDRDEPVYHWIRGNTSEHYEEHRGWLVS
jgi:uncharacterized damage-inducible protein DinB